MGMCVCLCSGLVSRLAPLSPFSPCVGAGWHARWVNRKKKGAKDRQDKEFGLMNFTTYLIPGFKGLQSGSFGLHHLTLPFVLHHLPFYPFTGESAEGQTMLHIVLEIQKCVLSVACVLLVSFSVAPGTGFGRVLCVLRVPGVLGVSYGCLYLRLWGCLHPSYMFCMFYRSLETDRGHGSKTTRVPKARQTRKMIHQMRTKKRTQVKRRRTKKPVTMKHDMEGSRKRRRRPIWPNGRPAALIRR